MTKKPAKPKFVDNSDEEDRRPVKNDLIEPQKWKEADKKKKKKRKHSSSEEESSEGGYYEKPSQKTKVVVAEEDPLSKPKKASHQAEKKEASKPAHVQKKVFVDEESDEDGLGNWNS